MSVVQVPMSQFLLSPERTQTIHGLIAYSITYGIYAFLLSFLLIVLVLDLLLWVRGSVAHM